MRVDADIAGEFYHFAKRPELAMVGGTRTRTGVGEEESAIHFSSNLANISHGLNLTPQAFVCWKRSQGNILKNKFAFVVSVVSLASLVISGVSGNLWYLSYRSKSFLTLILLLDLSHSNLKIFQLFFIQGTCDHLLSPPSPNLPFSFAIPSHMK